MRRLRLWKVGCAALAVSLMTVVCQAATWFPLGPYGGDARSLTADPADPNHVFLGTATGWIYDTHDGGRTWARVAQLENRHDLVVDHILADETNPKRLIVAAYTADRPDGGLFISEDYGKTWYSQAQMRGQSIRSLARSVSDPSELIAGTLKGIFRSTDNAVHWTQISPEGSGEIKEVQSIAIDPKDPNVIYAGTWHLPWKTTDGGLTWHNIKNGIIDDSDVFSIIVDPKQSNVVYASACSGIYKSEDAGDLFHKVQGIPSAARRTRKLAQDPEHLATVFAGTTEGLYRTLDAGAQWDRITPGNVIVNDVYVDPANVNHVLMATDRGGVYRSDDGGTTFEASNAGFSARQVIAFAADALNAGTMYVGVVNGKQTGGVFQSTDGGVHWEQQSDGLGGRDVFSLLSLPDGTLLAGTGHGVFRSQNGTWTDSSVLEPALEPVRRSVREDASGPESPTGLEPRPVSVSPPLGRPHFELASFVQSPRSRTKAKIAVARRTTTSAAAKTRVRAHRTAAAPRTRKASMAGARRPQAAVVNSRADEGRKPETVRLDGVIYTLTLAGNTLFAGSTQGLMGSLDDGQHWAAVSSLAMPEVHFIATLPAPQSGDEGTGQVILAAGLERLAMSPDGGTSWDAVALPVELTQIGAVGVDGDRNLWVGGREGVWLSTDLGAHWKTLRNLFVREVDSIYFDASGDRILVTSANSPVAFSVHLPDHKVSYWDTGWKLRFVRPVSDHLVGATLFDGMVVQPVMVASPFAAAQAGK